MRLHFVPEALHISHILTNQQGRQSLFDDNFGGEGSFAKLRNGFAPANQALFGFDTSQRNIALNAFVMGFRIGQRKSLDFANFHLIPFSTMRYTLTAPEVSPSTNQRLVNIKRITRGTEPSSSPAIIKP